MLHQGSWSVAKYVVEVQPLVADSGWNGTALQEVFHNRPCYQIKDELVARDEPEGLDSLISLLT